VEHYVCTCVKCEGMKSIHKKKYGLYKPLPIPNGLFESISMDFMTCLPLWEEKDIILVVVNRFSKLAKFGTTKTMTTMIKSNIVFRHVGKTSWHAYGHCK
jgi:putative transposase